METSQEPEEDGHTDALNACAEIATGMLGASSACAVVTAEGVQALEMAEESAYSKALETKPTNVLQKFSGVLSQAKKAFLLTAPEQNKWAGTQHKALESLVPAMVSAIRVNKYVQKYETDHTP